MFWATVNNVKTEPRPKLIGQCPACHGQMLSKCGEVNVWHWAHFNGENCDPWYEPESFWHLHWKMTFGKENAEVVIKKENKWHIADILTQEEVVIELQNSPIQKPVVRKREDFYGAKMMWLINGIPFKDNFKTTEGIDDNYWRNLYSNNPVIQKPFKNFKWSYARKSWSEVIRPVFIDFGEDTLFRVKKNMGTSSGTGVFVSKESFIKRYGGDYDYYVSHFQANDGESSPASTHL